MTPLKKTKEMRRWKKVVKEWDKVLKESAEQIESHRCESCGAYPGLSHTDDCSVWTKIKQKRSTSRQRLYEIAKKVRESQSTYPERFWAGSEAERTRKLLTLILQLSSDVVGGGRDRASDVENICRNLLQYEKN